jgi:predicted peptidase
MKTFSETFTQSRPFLWFGVLLAWTACVLPAQAMGPEEFAARIFTNAAGQTMPYRLLLPEDLSSGSRFPLVFFFHGAGERGVDNTNQLIHGTSLFLTAENRSRYACFVLAPQCPDKQQWVDMPWGADSGERPSEPSVAMQLALEILAHLLEDFPVDPQRLYVTGLSMGGYATWDCLTRFPTRFAAGVPVCGGGDEHTVTAAVAQVPVWAFHSDDDTVVKTQRTRNMIQAMRDAGGRPKYSEYSGLGHNSWDKAYQEPELLSWMFAQRLGKPDTYQPDPSRTQSPKTN